MLTHTHSYNSRNRNQVLGNARYLCETWSQARTLGFTCATTAYVFIHFTQQMCKCSHSIRYITQLCIRAATVFFK